MPLNQQGTVHIPFLYKKKKKLSHDYNEVHSVHPCSVEHVRTVTVIQNTFYLPVRIYLFILQKILLMLHSFRMTTGPGTGLRLMHVVYGNSEAQIFYKNISISYNYISLSSGLFHTVWHLTIVLGPQSLFLLNNHC